MARVRVSVSSVQEAMRRTRKESAQVSEGVGRGGEGGGGGGGGGGGWEQ